MRRPQSVLADEHILFLEGLESIVAPEIDVAGVARDGRALVELATRLRPDLILTEIALPLLSGTEAVVRIRKKLPRARAIFITKHLEKTHLTAALAAGASGYLTKNCTGAEVRAALKEIMSGRSYITPLITADLFATFRENVRQSSVRLTERQREVLQLVVEGHSIKEIAEILKVSRKTVDYHKYNLMQSVGARNTAQLLQYAIKEGFGTQPAGGLRLIGKSGSSEGS